MPLHCAWAFFAFVHYISVWCNFIANFILGRFSFEQNTSQGPQKCSITDSRYCNLFQKYVIPALRQRQCLETTVFLQDGAPSPIAQQVTALCRAHFGDERVISRGFPTAWPPRSPELNPCDFWLWGFLSDYVDWGNLQTVRNWKQAYWVIFLQLIE